MTTMATCFIEHCDGKLASMEMNKQIQNFARNELKKGLTQLPEGHCQLFKRMYSHNNLNADINDVVDSMPEEKLDWAMQQVQNSLDKIQAI